MQRRGMTSTPGLDDDATSGAPFLLDVHKNRFFGLALLRTNHFHNYHLRKLSLLRLTL